MPPPSSGCSEVPKGHLNRLVGPYTHSSTTNWHALCVFLPPRSHRPLLLCYLLLPQLLNVIIGLSAFCLQLSPDLKLDLPQIAVVGSQSSGKSSVLEALVGGWRVLAVVL